MITVTNTFESLGGGEPSQVNSIRSGNELARSIALGLVVRFIGRRDGELVHVTKPAERPAGKLEKEAAWWDRLHETATERGGTVPLEWLIENMLSPSGPIQVAKDDADAPSGNEGNQFPGCPRRPADWVARLVARFGGSRIFETARAADSRRRELWCSWVDSHLVDGQPGIYLPESCLLWERSNHARNIACEYVRLKGGIVKPGSPKISRTSPRG